MNNFKRNIMITGGAGFIGSHVVRRMVNNYADYHIVNLDKLTYAGNLENLRDVERKPNYTFVRADICDGDTVLDTMRRFNIDGVIHLAAESHVDRSIRDPFVFAKTNIGGTLSLLQAALTYWEEAPGGMEGKLFHHISTDEVFGSLNLDLGISFSEEDPYQPNSPYSASKASSDHFVRAFHHTYGLPTVISNCSNNYGPNQFPEKFIPLIINNIRHHRPIPVYGRGINVRDWLYVEDHATAIDIIFHRGAVGESYNVGGYGECNNLKLVRMLIEITDRLLGNPVGHSRDLITFVPDRKGHDMRYAINPSKLCGELRWEPTVLLTGGLEKTVRWYLANQEWMDRVTSGEYEKYYETYYSHP